MANQDEESWDKEPEYCTICYTNELKSANSGIVEEGEVQTFELECGHRFCSECVYELLKQVVERAEVEKVQCLDYECKKPITRHKVKTFLISMNKTELYDKYKRFVRKRLMESDPLVRWCTKPGCGMNMKAENMDATKLTCPECSTEVCFKCRDTWHGENKTCQDALRDRFEGWVSENKGNCSFCPCCRTKIEKTTGCN